MVDKRFLLLDSTQTKKLVSLLKTDKFLNNKAITNSRGKNPYNVAIKEQNF